MDSFLIFRDTVSSLNSAKQRYLDTGKIKPIVFDFLKEVDFTSSKKYLEWLCKVIHEGGGLHNNILLYLSGGFNKDNILNDYRKFLLLYEKCVKAKLMYPDIRKYPKWVDFCNEAEENSKLLSSPPLSEMIRPLKEGVDYKMVSDNKNWTVVSVLTYDASKNLGRDIGWCIVQERRYWNSYDDKYKWTLFVFKKKGNRHLLRFCVHVRGTGFHNYSVDVTTFQNQPSYEITTLKEVCSLFGIDMDFFAPEIADIGDAIKVEFIPENGFSDRRKDEICYFLRKGAFVNGLEQQEWRVRGFKSSFNGTDVVASPVWEDGGRRDIIIKKAHPSPYDRIFFGNEDTPSDYISFFLERDVSAFDCKAAYKRNYFFGVRVSENYNLKEMPILCCEGSELSPIRIFTDKRPVGKEGEESCCFFRCMIESDIYDSPDEYVSISNSIVKDSDLTGFRLDFGKNLYLAGKCVCYCCKLNFSPYLEYLNPVFSDRLCSLETQFDDCFFPVPVPRQFLGYEDPSLFFYLKGTVRGRDLLEIDIPEVVRLSKVYESGRTNDSISLSRFLLENYYIGFFRKHLGVVPELFDD